MDLEEYRLKHKLSYEALAEKIGCGYRRNAQRIASGEQWPQAWLVQDIIERCKGVTIADMHQRHLRFEQNKREKAA